MDTDSYMIFIKILQNMPKKDLIYQTMNETDHIVKEKTKKKVIV